MTQPTYRCVECSQPAPAGQLLCAACAARVHARRQPPHQTPHPPAPSAYPASSASPSAEGAAVSAQTLSANIGIPLPEAPLPNASVPPPSPVRRRLDLHGNFMPDTPAPAAAPSAPAPLPPPPQYPGVYAGGGQYGRAATDPDALLAQLKQAEGGRYALPSGNSPLERFATRLAGRIALRVGVGAILGLFVVISRLTGGAHSGSATEQMPDTDTPTQFVGGRPASGGNGIAAARNSLQTAAAPLTSNAQTYELRAAIGRVNAAWADVKSVLLSADMDGMRTDHSPDYRPYIQQLEQDYQIIKQALPLMPFQDHQQCVRMMRAIEAAQNELNRMIPQIALPMPGSYPDSRLNQGASEGATPNNTPSLPPSGGGAAPTNRTVPAGQPTAQPAPAPQESGTQAPQGAMAGGTLGGQSADNLPPPGASQQGAPSNPGQTASPSSSPPGSSAPAPGGGQNP